MIKLIILDVDGVLTDGKKYYDRPGNVVMKTFCDKDWTAIKRFKALGIHIIFLTGDPFNEAIAKNRNIEVIVNRKNGKHKDKGDYVEDICKKYKINTNEIVFVGDDIFDIGIMNKVKYSYCPGDAPKEVQEIANVLDKNGGQNCVMSLFDQLKEEKLLPNFKLQEHIDNVYKLDIKEKF